MESTGLPPYSLPAMIVTGFVIVVLIGVNAGQIVVHRRDTKDAEKSSSLGKWAWGISIVSLLVPYFALISLPMAAVDLFRIRRNTVVELYLKRPSSMAMINSVSATLFIVMILGLFVFRWTE